MPHGYKCSVTCEPPYLKLHFAILLMKIFLTNSIKLMQFIVMERGWSWGAGKIDLTHQTC